MAAIHTALQTVVKYFNPTKTVTHIDDFRISQVQYKAVFGVLVACAIISGLTNWYSRIDCSIPETTALDKKYIEEWCYANSTFIVKEGNDGFSVGNQFAPSSDTVLHLGYYQWVTLALILQAACFQIPRLIWKCFEGGRVQKIVSQLAKVDSANREQRILAIRDVVNYFYSPFRTRSSRHYFAYFAVCQCLYFINVVLQLCFTQTFLQNEFLNLLPQFVQGTPGWNRVFPKIVKCNTFAFGSPGTPQTIDVLCVLSMNVLFEKLYIMVWIIFVVALCASIVQNLQLLWFILGSPSFSAEEDEPLSATDRLLLKFLKLSLDPSLFDELLKEIQRSGPGAVKA